MNLRNAVVRLLLLTFSFTAITPSAGFIAYGQTETPANESPDGLRFRLSEGAAPTPTPAAKPPVVAKHLSDLRTQQLLSRLPAIQSLPTDKVDFKLRESSLPPPAIAKVIQAAFAPPGAEGPPVAAPTMAPLEVLRVSPEGPVKLATAITITFSQPMVDVSSQSEAADQIPVTLSPQPKGSWRWLGTQTLMFQPTDEGGRLPMATEYTLTIPSGTRSKFGNGLAETRTIKFATPAPTLTAFYPGNSSGNPRDPLMYLEFDQRIDTARLLEQIRLQPASNGVHLRNATPVEIAANGSVANYVKQAQPSRWLALRAVDATGATKDVFPIATEVKLMIPAGTNSAEGPLMTLKDQELTFTTYGALRITNSEVLDQNTVPPFQALQVGFSNGINVNNFPVSKVTVTPTIPDMQITFGYNEILINGSKKSNTDYTVTVDRSLIDIYGQTLTGRNTSTFHVRPAESRLISTDNGFLVLDPAVKKTFSIYSVNYRQVRVRLSRVAPTDWTQFRKFQYSHYHTTENTERPPGTVVFDQVMDLAIKPDELMETAIELSPALTNGYGQVFLQVDPIEEKSAPVKVYSGRRYQDTRVESWVQVTDMAVDAFADNMSVLAWANSLTDGKPLSGVQVQLLPDSLSGTTDAQGLARFDKPDRAQEAKDVAVMVARRGEDVAILPYTYEQTYFNSDPHTWFSARSADTLTWYVFDDRKLYRPGEEVTVKGWIRRINTTPRGDTELFKFDEDEWVNYTLKDSEDNEITKGKVNLNVLAGFDLKLTLPPTMNLGEAKIEFELEDEGDEYTHTFKVEEFRRPEFEIKAESSEGPHLIGSNATVKMNAVYYTGGGLANTEVKWTVRSIPTNYTPPNRGDYTFGKFYPWWFARPYESETSREEFVGRTNADGDHTLRIDFDGVRPARASSVTAEARVQDVNRQTLATNSTFLVHSADLYVGLKSARTFVQAGEEFKLDAIVTDLDGKAVAGRDIKLRLSRWDYVYASGAYIQTETDIQEQTIKSGADSVPFSFPTTKGGQYRLTAEVSDDQERMNETELSLWVAGGNQPPNRNISQEKVELIPDRRTYSGGDVAEILVQSPFTPAEGVVTWRRSGLMKSARFTMDMSSYTLKVPIEEAMTPNLHVQVDLVGQQPRNGDDGNPRADLPKRPAYASGELNLEVSSAKRKLSVTAAPRDGTLEPGKETVIDVVVKNSDSKAVRGAETAVVVVDEAVLALTDYRLTDPLNIFYSNRDGGVADLRLRPRLKLADPKEVERLAAEINAYDTLYSVNASSEMISSLPINGRQLSNLYVSAPGTIPTRQFGLIRFAGGNINVITKSGTTEPANTPIALLTNFNALAIFAAAVPTDARGRAHIKVKLPDNLTRYRVMVVAVAGGRFAGTGESAITARKQLMARPSAPRFLNFGDKAELPVVLQNQTNRPIQVDVAVRATNAEITDGAGRTVTVPANDRVEIRFPVAASLPGMARFQIVTAGGRLSDAAEVSLPVYTPATTEAFATYGTIDQGSIAQPVKAPADAVTGYGGLEVTTASTQLQELTDAVIYLVRYPFECSEQISSRLLALAALKDVLTAFKAEGLPSPEEMKASVDIDIKRLKGLQNGDGGFDFWRKDAPSNPYVSVHVAHALIRAQSKGFVVPEDMLNSSKYYLKNIEDQIPKEYSDESRWAIEAYALYVRDLMKDTDSAKALKLIADAGGAEKLSLESLGWILPALSANPSLSNEVQLIRRSINNRVTETAGAAHFAENYSDGAYTILYSDRRTDGILLEALIGDQPKSDLIPKLVRGLLNGREKGHWHNTQENAFILLALDRYFNTYEKIEPNFVARVWLGKDYAGDQTYKGRSTDRQQLNLPMAALAEKTAAGPANLTIAKEGEGRLYYRIGTRYAPRDLKLAAADYGFKVDRVYEAIDSPADVRRDPDGTWVIKAGARVRVRLSMSNPARRYHVALVDPLPAGLEVLNPELKTTEALPDDNETEGRNYWYWRSIWYDHQNLRDDRIEAFTSYLWEGVHAYTYFARATTLGLFVVPPTKAEEMYAPETFGRGHSDKVRIE
ncbi:MAG: DUF6049 family protein [Pyrinomonadaceae bacterium]